MAAKNNRLKISKRNYSSKRFIIHSRSYLFAEIPALVGFVPTTIGPIHYDNLLGIEIPTSYSVLVEWNSDDMIHQGNEPLDIFQRANNGYKWIRRRLKFDEMYRFEQSLFDDRFKNFPPLLQIATNMTYLFQNTNELLDHSRPSPPKLKYIGGIHLAKRDNAEEMKNRTKNEDEEEIKALVLASANSNTNSSTKGSSCGTIIFSFGSLIQAVQIPPQTLSAFVDALSQFPQCTVVWRFDATDAQYNEAWRNDTNSQSALHQIATILQQTPHIHRYNWIPQKALFEEPFLQNIRIFITHMGMNSYIELAHAGIPTISIPIFADQFYNTGAAIVKNGMGLWIDKTKITKEALANAIHEILSNPSYKQNAKELSALLADEPKHARARFLRGVERAARFPTLRQALKLPSMEMRPFVYNNLDILAVAIAVLLVVSTVSFYAIKVTISRLNSLLKRRTFLTRRKTAVKHSQQRKNE